MIPNSILYNEKISTSAKILYGCISSHCAKTGYCYASNKYLAEKLSIKVRQIQRLLLELSEVLDIQEVQSRRQIRLVGGVSKMTRGGVINDTHNNTSIIVPNKLGTSASEKKVSELFELYKTSFGAPKTLFTLKRKQKISARIKVCGEGMVERAIRVTAVSPFHRGENDRKWKADLDFIIRSDEQVERLASMGGSAVDPRVFGKLD